MGNMALIWDKTVRILNTFHLNLEMIHFLDSSVRFLNG
jgi:hypothetical protein